MKFLKRWREDRSKAQFEVHVHNPNPEQVAQDLLLHDRRRDRTKADYPGVYSLEGDKWAVHADNGTVYLSGEDGLVQVQFAPDDASTLGMLLMDAHRH